MPKLDAITKKLQAEMQNKSDEELKVLWTEEEGKQHDFTTQVREINANLDSINAEIREVGGYFWDITTNDEEDDLLRQRDEIQQQKKHLYQQYANQQKRYYVINKELHTRRHVLMDRLNTFKESLYDASLKVENDFMKLSEFINTPEHANTLSSRVISDVQRGIDTLDTVQREVQKSFIPLAALLRQVEDIIQNRLLEGFVVRSDALSQAKETETLMQDGLKKLDTALGELRRHKATLEAAEIQHAKSTGAQYQIKKAEIEQLRKMSKEDAIKFKQRKMGKG